MRYLGNKTSLTDFLWENVPDQLRQEGSCFYDGFSGTASVGKYFREKQLIVSSSDIMFMSYVLQKAYIEFSADRDGIKRYENILDELNSIEPVEGYVWENFSEEGTAGLAQPRMFFLPDNARKIDAIRLNLDSLLERGDITQLEFFALLATLLETVSLHANVSGVYAAFLKQYDPRALKPLELRPIFSEPITRPSGNATWGSLESLAPSIKTDILYLDPPYNARQYAPNYHVLETIARYDSPVARGVSGLRDYTEMKSAFCSKKNAPIALQEILTQSEWKTMMMSYNSEGIMPTDTILSVLEEFGKTSLIEKEYRRYKSNKGEAQHIDRTKPLSEQLFIVSR